MSASTQHYIRHSKVELEPVLEAIRDHIARRADKKERVIFNDVPVKVASLRLQTFATKGLVCVSCGLEASFFALETQAFNSQNQGHHLNLWGVKESGEEVLFTHDHVLARGLGGKDNLENCQTMCSPCNAQKAKIETAYRETFQKGKP